MCFVSFLPLFVEFKKDDRRVVVGRKKSTISGLPLMYAPPRSGHQGIDLTKIVCYKTKLEVVKEIQNGHVEEMEVEWWFEQDIDDEEEENEEGEGGGEMAAVAQNTNNTTIRSILLAEKLTGLIFTNGYRNIKIVLRYEKKIKFVEQPIRPALDPEATDSDTIDKYYESVNLEQEVAYLMLSSMPLDLQRTLEKYNAFDMMKELKTMFEEQAKQELF
nr:hypothetical protein [Tanacetum cinerariifolium]